MAEVSHLPLADSAHNNEQKLMTIVLDEFLRRFLLHLLPKGFVRIRNFGFLANRKRATNLPLCFQLLGSAAAPPIEQDRSGTNNPSDLWRCPKCGGSMVVVERLTPAEIQLRSPPLWGSGGCGSCCRKWWRDARSECIDRHDRRVPRYDTA